MIGGGISARVHSTWQKQIHALRLEHARAGRRVVRLKGSDSFALVECPQQRVISGMLGRLATDTRQQAVTAPALLILSEVAALAQTLHWFGNTPLPPHSPITALDTHTLAHAA